MRWILLLSLTGIACGSDPGDGADVVEPEPTYNAEGQLCPVPVGVSSGDGALTLGDIYVPGLMPTGDCDASYDAVTLRFGLRTTETEARLIAPGSRVSGTSLTVGESFVAEDLVMSNARLFPSPDVGCTDSSHCAELGDGFSCQPLTGSRGMVCAQDIAMSAEAGSLRYVDRGPLQETILSHYIGGTMMGAHPELGGEPPILSELKSDPALDGAAAASSYLGILPEVQDPASRVCLSNWSSDGSANFVPERATCYLGHQEAQDRALPVTAVASFDRALWSNLASDASQTEQFGCGASSDTVLLTDGDDTGSLSETAYATAMMRVQELGIQVHLAHLDNLGRDDEHQSIYPGPVGGSDLMARMACESDGSYQIASQPTDLYRVFEALAYTSPGYFEVDLALPALASPDLPVGAYRLAFTLEATLHGEPQAFDYDTGMGASGVEDRRLVVFRR